MIRKIITIDQERCDGCGLCVEACHEGAIGLVDGKAQLLRDDYCDGLGDCLPVCPRDAISFEEREAAAYDEAAVKENMKKGQPSTLACGCPGTDSRAIKREAKPETTATAEMTSQLNQWPVQIRLVPPNAPYLQGASLLIAADCTAYAYGNFHDRYMKDKITLVGCPKLDDCDYSQKLTAILEQNDIEDITVVRMEVPCCRGLEQAVKDAMKRSGKIIPWRIEVISTDGKIVKP